MLSFKKNNPGKGTPNKKSEKSTPKDAPQFLLKGTAAQKALAEEEHQAEQRQKDRENRADRFWIKEGNDTILTFLDGYLNDEGMLDPPMYWEHQLNMSGHWRNWFVCLKTINQYCPICENDNSALVAVFTVIDHSTYETKKGDIITDQVKLYVCKMQTLQQLRKLAAKTGGLAGVSYEVSRIGDNAANVGNMFQFLEQNPVKDIIAKLSTEEKKISVFNYEQVIQFRTVEELSKLGFGGKSIGDESLSEHL
ncbi:MAG: hypothetical protein GWN00_01250 [Aliifodinibius sp.]|nr:hypothetical protein [Fodinibius sp.]NIV09958.1 hypothetical protein [Fodinibius sp.]NIY23488.1 hypothetical protein [Fodinibius sp.]